MNDKEKILTLIDDMIKEAQEEPQWRAESALKCLKCNLIALLKEQEGYVSVPFWWLVNFCTHIEFDDPLWDKDREKLWKQKLKQQFDIDVP